MVYVLTNHCAGGNFIENEKRVKSDIDDRADDHTGHRKLGRAVGTDKVTHHVRNNKKRHRRDDEAWIFHRKPQGLTASAEEGKKLFAEEKGEISLPPFYAGTFFIYAKKCKEPRQELKYISPEEYFENTKRHFFVYTVFANTLFYRLRKDPQDEGFEITHLYLANPLPLKKGTDRTPIPSQYIEALVLGAMARAEEYRDNFDYAQIYRNQQEQLLTNMKLRYGPGNLSAENRAKLPFFGGSYDGRI